MSGDFNAKKRIDMADYPITDTDIYTGRVVLYDSFPPHWHNHYEFEYYIGGSGYQIINGTKFAISPGTLCVFSPTDFHEIIVKEPLEVLKLAYQESDIDPFISSLLLGFPTSSPICLDEKDNELFCHQFLSLIETAKLYHDSPYGQTVIRKLTESIILNTINLFFKNNSRPEILSDVQFDDIQGVLVYIHKNFNKRITLKSTAKSSHFSPTYLSRLFHRKMGISFKEYVTKLRMNYASKLLQNTQKSVTDICYESGFGSFSSFAKKFKKVYSISPTKYRKIKATAKGRDNTEKSKDNI